MSALDSGNYAKTRAMAESDPQGFWAGIAEGITWDKRWDKVIDDSRKPFYRWFTGGVLNTCYNCVDRHVESGHGDQIAIVFESESGESRDISYAELQEMVATVRTLADCCAGDERPDCAAKSSPRSAASAPPGSPGWNRDDRSRLHPRRWSV